ncbi:MAG: septation protein IspZ [Alphaproteobacteria bacterium]|nr:septation protein IspZ [Alphaproteobacteria bacterium]
MDMRLAFWRRSGVGDYVRLMNPLQKLALDLTPLVIFLVSYYVSGVYWATGIFIGATVIAAAISYAATDKLSPLMMFSGVFVIVLGGLTIWLQNDLFIKLKPTIYYLSVAGLLLVGLAFKRLVIKDLMEFAYKLTDEGWQIFTKRLAVFFVGLAALNVAAAYTLSFEAWLWFKIGGFTALVFVFFLSQEPLFNRYEIKSPDEETPKTA